MPSLLRYRRNRCWIRALAGFLIAAWLSSVFYTSCIMPAQVDQVVMQDCSAPSAPGHRPDDHHPPAPKDCASQPCFTALAGSDDGIVIEKSSSWMPVFWIALVLFSVLFTADSSRARLNSQRADFRLSKRTVPLIYQFCSLLN